MTLRPILASVVLAAGAVWGQSPGKGMLTDVDMGRKPMRESLEWLGKYTDFPLVVPKDLIVAGEFGGGFFRKGSDSQAALRAVLRSSDPKLGFDFDGARYILRYLEPIVSGQAGEDVRSALERLFSEANQRDGKTRKLEWAVDETVRAGHGAFQNKALSDAVDIVVGGANPPLTWEPDESGGIKVFARRDALMPALAQTADHRGEIRTVGYSPDGKFVATGDLDGLVNVWDTGARRVLRSATGFLAERPWSVDGNRIVIYWDRTVFMVDRATGRIETVMRTPDPVFSAYYVGELDRIVVSDRRGRVFVGQAVGPAKPKGALNFPRPVRCVLTRDGTQLLCFMPEGGTAEARSLLYRQDGFDYRLLDKEPIPVGDDIVNLDVSSDSKYFAYSTVRGNVGLHTLADGAFVKLVSKRATRDGRPPQPGRPVPIAFASRRPELAFSPENETVLFVDPTRPDRAPATYRRTGFAGYSWPVNALAYAPEDREIVVGLGAFEAVPDKLTVLDGRTRARLGSLRGDVGQIRRVEFTQGGRQMITVSEQGFRVWDPSLATPPSFQAGRNIELPPCLPYEASKNRPLIRYLLGRGSLGGLTLWSQDGTSRQTYPEVSLQNLSRVVWSGDAGRFLVQRYDGKIEIWMPGGIVPESFYQEPVTPIRFLRASSSGRYFAVSVGGFKDGKRFGTVRLVDGLAAKVLGEQTREEDFRDDSVAFAMLREVVAFEDNGTVTVYELEAGSLRELGKVPGYSPAFNAEGTRLAVELQGKVRVYDVRTNGSVELPTRDLRSPRFSADGKRLIAFSPDRRTVYLHSFDVEQGLKLLHAYAHRSSVLDVAIHPTADMIATVGTDGYLRLWDTTEAARDGSPVKSHPRFRSTAGRPVLKPGSLLCEIQTFGDYGYLAKTRDNHYLASKDAAKSLRFEAGGELYPFDQFDLRLNRPDLVLGDVGIAPADRIRVLNGAYLKRLEFLGVPESALTADFRVPDRPVFQPLPPPTTNQGVLRLTVRLSDARYSLESLHVFVNNVPLYGTRGQALKPLHGETRTVAAKEIVIPLSVGSNEIRVAVRNANLGMSLEATANVRYAPATPPKPRLFALLVGVKDYDPASGYRPLRAPLSDVESLEKALLALKTGTIAPAVAPSKPAPAKRARGRRAPAPVPTPKPATPKRTYDEVRILALKGPKATRLAILQARKFLEQAGPDDVVILFFAGHGQLEDRSLQYYFVPADGRKSDLEGTAVSYEAIESLVDGVASRRKLILLDSCQSGLIDRYVPPPVSGRGGGTGPLPPADLDPTVGTGISEELSVMLESFTDLGRGTGSSVIAAATGGKEAQERDHGFFTQAILQALGGKRAQADANKDGVVTVSELRTYVVNEVERLSGGTQRPMVRKENELVNFPVG
ncbi:MAG: caspase family protein [Fimbriimonadaceae bacterium]|nr:caspase family protein [Fimbriimonadaceae bacterium]